ncbi:hypothetical protein WA026_002380 [Henosepilachna vigintioctopunctata]|uniref:Methyltransferase domain-containing protein n=1 Tax=Henosepilachna vigintioctopunctata TaxID=420089 RepID=A0AAW1U0L9_9CUCU
MKEESVIYIEAYDEGHGIYSVSVETLVILYVYQCSESTKSIDLRVKLVETSVDVPVKLDFSHLPYSIIVTELEKLTSYCKWPIITIGNTVVAGLSAVARQIIKSSSNEKVKHLLGFRESCLMACSEASVWTMFCEVDMLQSIKIIMKKLLSVNSGIIQIPKDISRFEYHLSQPVRIHNIYKVASTNSRKKLSTDVPRDALSIQHTFAEGPTMTISDVILYTYFDLFFKLLENKNLDQHFPLIYHWYKIMQNASISRVNLVLPVVLNLFDISIDNNFIKQSLYRSDMSNYKMEKKTYTKQTNIERALEIINSSKITISNSNALYGSDVELNWEDIPIDINPCGGSLPEKRSARKCDQLESMAKPVIKIAGNSKYTIIDFCSGSGHLGLLLAYLLPNSHIVLVENKEKSLARARIRIESLKLKNVTTVQSNLDYFCGDFQIGVSLHACGTATDLVMQSCVKNLAHFVCSPCCYGGIKKCHLVDYPRSQIFSKLSNFSYFDYLCLAHAADQTHDVLNVKTQQGFLCMDAIDTDRKLYAEYYGYNVILGKLHPANCTNKNNLIVGIRKN